MCIWLRCETNTTTTITSGTYLFDHKMKIFFARCRETFVSFALPFFDQIKILFSCRCRRRRPSSSLSPVAHFDELHYDFHDWKINGHSFRSHCLSTAEYCFVFALIMRFVCFLETVWRRHGMRGRKRDRKGDLCCDSNVQMIPFPRSFPALRLSSFVFKTSFLGTS